VNSSVEPPLKLPLGATRRLPLGLQVFLGIGGIVALVAVAVVIGVVLISGLGNGTEELTDREVQYARAIDAAALRAKAMANDERGFLLSGNKEFLLRLERRVGRVRVSFVNAAHAASGSEQREAVRQASAGFEKWLSALRAEVATYEAGKTDAAIATTLGPTRDLRHDYEQTLARAQLLGDRAIESGSDSVSSASARSVEILLAYLLVAFAIAAFIAVWLVRTIVRPVYALLAIFAEPGATQSLVDRYNRIRDSP
jgi:methyl-accepting chemotaxis protein